MMTLERRSVDDGSVSLDAAASSLGITHKRLMTWLENNEWMVIGDTSYDVVWGQVEAGNLAVKHGSVRITPQGMTAIRADFVTVAGGPSRNDTSEIPF